VQQSKFHGLPTTMSLSIFSLILLLISCLCFQFPHVLPLLYWLICSQRCYIWSLHIWRLIPQVFALEWWFFRRKSNYVLYKEKHIVLCSSNRRLWGEEISSKWNYFLTLRVICSLWTGMMIDDAWYTCHLVGIIFRLTWVRRVDYRYVNL